ncbi:hypothetical protein Q5752_005595 [Cryptotrichosporon argae]
MLALLTLALAAPAAALSGLVSDPTQVAGQSFDYIVVGAGLGGLVVANRLSENAGVTVLVIEAGTDNRTDAVVYNPQQYSQAFGTDIDWAWQSSQGRTIRGGKTLGGSTSINGMAYTRGQRAQYDALTTLLGGDDGGGYWNWDGMFAGMLRAEGFSAPNSAQQAAGASSNASYHNTTGPLGVTYPDGIYQGPQQKYFKQVASESFAIPASADADGGDAAVVAFHPDTISWQDNDDRSSSATAYWSPIEARANIAVLTSQMVTKLVLTNTTSGVNVTGVQFGRSDGGNYTAHASREVIVSAGAIQTPALLQLSGIGDPNVLQPLGIDVIVDLPGVGKNLQEQTMDSIGWTPVDGFNGDGTGPSDCIAYPDIDALFGSNASSIAAQINASIAGYAQSAFDAGAFVSADAALQVFQIQQDLMVSQGVGLVEIFFDTGYPNGGLGIDMWQMMPFSRGAVNITSTDPFTQPTIDPRYFAADVDLTIQIAGCQIARKMFQTAPLSTLVTSENAPGFDTVADDGNGGSSSEWESWITQGFSSVHHPTSKVSTRVWN